MRYMLFLIAMALLAAVKSSVAQKSPPTMHWLGSFSIAPVSANNGDAFHNLTDNKSYVMENRAWKVLAEVSVGPQGPKGDPGVVPSGNAPGDMQYWNGTQWVVIPGGMDGQTMTFCNGKPSWDPCPSTTVTDIDGNVYHTIKLGSQTWTKENLRTTRFNDGSAIPLVADTSTWANLITPAYCWLDNNVNFKDTCGALYNWHSVNSGKLAPAGWHVPADAEWTELENYLIANGYNWDGSIAGNKIAKSIASTTWWVTYTSNAGAVGNDPSKNNRTGFSGFPSGTRYYDGNFDIIGSYAHWWSATDNNNLSFASYRGLHYDLENLDAGACYKSSGLSVRLV